MAKPYARAFSEEEMELVERAMGDEEGKIHTLSSYLSSGVFSPGTRRTDKKRLALAKRQQMIDTLSDYVSERSGNVFLDSPRMEIGLRQAEKRLRTLQRRHARQMATFKRDLKRKRDRKRGR